MQLPKVTNRLRALITIAAFVAGLVTIGITLGWNWAIITVIGLAVAWSLSPLNIDRPL